MDKGKSNKECYFLNACKGEVCKAIRTNYYKASLADFFRKNGIMQLAVVEIEDDKDNNTSAKV